MPYHSLLPDFIVSGPFSLWVETHACCFYSFHDGSILLQCELYETHHSLTFALCFSFSPQVGRCLEDTTTCTLPNPVLPTWQVLLLNVYVFSSVSNMCPSYICCHVTHFLNWPRVL